MRAPRPAGLFLLVAAGGLAAAETPPPAVAPAPYAAPAQIATVTAPDLEEMSGLAVGRANPTVLWTHNDSGGKPELYALDASGAVVATLRVTGAKAVDWEDCASAVVDGTAWLVAADVGDNGSKRKDCVLYVVAEPTLPATATAAAPVTVNVAPTFTIPLVWPDGPRDCESVAIDAAAGDLLLISKRVVPPVLYRLPLKPSADGTWPAATAIGPLTGIPLVDPLIVVKDKSRAYDGQPTSADLDADGALVVLTYGGIWRWPRLVVDGVAEPWAAAIARPPQGLDPVAHRLSQQEALACTPDGIVFTTENLPAPLWRIPRTPAPAPR